MSNEWASRWQWPRGGSRLRTLVIVAAACSACRSERVVDLDFSRGVRAADVAAPKDQVLRVAVGTFVSPESTYASYARLADMLAAGVSRRAELVQRESYEQVNRLLLDGEVDVALICTGAYIPIRDRVRLLAVPVFAGHATYYSVVIAHRPGPISLAELRGKRFAFTDPLSNPGRPYPPLLLPSQFQSPPRMFFATLVSTGHHDGSIREVADGAVDGAAVDSLVLGAYLRDPPQRATDLVELHRSPPFGAPPFVARLGLPADLVESIRKLLLALHEDPAGREHLSKIGVERFEPSGDYQFAAKVAGEALPPASELASTSTTGL